MVLRYNYRIFSHTSYTLAARRRCVRAGCLETRL